MIAEGKVTGEMAQITHDSRVDILESANFKKGMDVGNGLRVGLDNQLYYADGSSAAAFPLPAQQGEDFDSDDLVSDEEERACLKQWRMESK